MKKVRNVDATGDEQQRSRSVQRRAKNAMYGRGSIYSADAMRMLSEARNKAIRLEAEKGKFGTKMSTFPELTRFDRLQQGRGLDYNPPWHRVHG